MQKQRGNVNRDRNSEKESEGNTRNQKHCNKFRNAFGGLISRLNKAKERIGELVDWSIKTFQTKIQR